MTRADATRAGAAALALALPAGCSDRGGDAGSATPVDSASVPDTAAAVEGPAIRGTVRTPDGAAVPGARVEVTLVRSNQERRAVGIGAASSLGLSCFADKRGCRAPHRDGVSAGDGTFAVEMPVNNGDPPVAVAVSVVAGADEQSRVGTTVVLPASAVRGASVDVPVAAGKLKLLREGNRLRVRMPAVSGVRPAGAVGVTLTQLAAEGDVSGATTDFSETSVRLPFDPRVAEDSRVPVTARQAGRLKGREATMSATEVLAGNLLPASRDASCALTDSRGRQRAQKPCGLTDGVLGSSWSPDDDPRCQEPCPGKLQNDHRDVVVRLPRAVSATLLVVRGCGFTCKVSVSSDGRRWRELPEPQSSGTDGFYVQPLSGAPVRAVKVTTATGGFFTKPREVSVFRQVLVTDGQSERTSPNHRCDSTRSSDRPGRVRATRRRGVRTADRLTPVRHRRAGPGRRRPRRHRTRAVPDRLEHRPAEPRGRPAAHRAAGPAADSPGARRTGGT